MLKKARSFINENRMYAWMIAFIILLQSFSMAVNTGDLNSAKDSYYQREQFKIEVESKQEALRELLLNNRELAYNFGLIFMFVFGLLITGIFFLAHYISRRRESVNIIPRTLNPPETGWSLSDVLKVVILFVFFHYFFSIFDIVVSTGLTNLLILFLILKVVIFKRRQSLKALGISSKNILQNIQIGLYSYITFLPILAILFFSVIVIAGLLNYTPPPQPVYELIFKEERPFFLVLTSFLIVLLGPITEEVFFRGFLYSALRKTLGIASAVIISGFLFSFLHINLLGFIPILVLGTFLAYMREKTGSLIPCITIHIVHNSAIALMMFFIRGVTLKAV
jgi:membrane protease YdiL (CAAX protease family)